MTEIDSGDDLCHDVGVTRAQGPACCPQGLAAPMDRDEAEALAGLLRAVADPARLQVLALLRTCADGELCVTDLVEPLGLTQPTVSHHLRVLVEAGLVTRRPEGAAAWYAIVPARLRELSRVFI